MRRWFAAFLGLAFLLMAQTMLLPRWIPLGFVPDLFLLTVILVGFWKPKGQAFWLGLCLGLLQGWIHGAGWWAFASSRAFAGIFATWMRNQWLWQSPPAAGFCAAVSTIASEVLLAFLLTLSERNLAPLTLLFTVGSFEAIFNAVTGFAVSRLILSGEVPAGR